MSEVQENSSGDVEAILILSGQEHALGGDNSTQVGQLCVKELALWCLQLQSKISEAP